MGACNRDGILVNDSKHDCETLYGNVPHLVGVHLRAVVQTRYIDSNTDTTSQRLRTKKLRRTDASLPLNNSNTNSK